MRVGGHQKPCSYYSRSIAGDVCLVLATEAEAAINMQLVLLSHLHGHLSAVKLSYAEDLLSGQKLLQEHCTLLDLQHMEHKGHNKVPPIPKAQKIMLDCKFSDPNSACRECATTSYRSNCFTFLQSELNSHSYIRKGHVKQPCNCKVCSTKAHTQQSYHV